MNKQLRTGLLLGGLVIAGYLALFGDKSPTGVVEPAGTALNLPLAQDDEERATNADGEVARLASREPIATALVRPSQDIDLFASKQAAPPPQEEGAAEVEQAPPPPPEPAFHFIGKKYDSGRWTVFLEKENQPIIANQGSVIDGFRIDAIQDKEIHLTHLDSKSKHIIPTEGGS